MSRSFVVQAALLVAVSSAHGSALRLACEGSAEGANVTVNKIFRGPCPIDVQVKPGRILVMATKTIDGKPIVFNHELMLGEGATKRIDITFGDGPGGAETAPVRAAPVAAVVIDPKAVAKERYEAELAEYQQSIASCLPRHQIEKDRLRQRALDEMNAQLSQCKARARSGGKPGDWSWQAFYKMECGPDKMEDREYEASHLVTPAEKQYLNFVGAKQWCQAQFTAPRAPQ